MKVAHKDEHHVHSTKMSTKVKVHPVHTLSSVSRSSVAFQHKMRMKRRALKRSSTLVGMSEDEGASVLPIEWGEELHLNSLEDRVSELENLIEHSAGEQTRISKQLKEQKKRMRHDLHLVEVGQIVMASLPGSKGTWRPGKVMAVHNDGSCDVEVKGKDGTHVTVLGPQAVKKVDDRAHHDYNTAPCTCEYQLLWIISTLFVLLLRFVFCIVFALLIHKAHKEFYKSIAIGIHVQLISCVVSCLAIATFSKIGVSIGGPDIIVPLFTADMAKIIGNRIQAGLVEHEQALPTLLLMIFLTTFITAVFWIIIGFARVSRIIDFLPMSVQAGFLACIGYKVCLYAVKLSVGHEWYAGHFGQTWNFYKLLIAGIPLGFALYYMKKFHKRTRIPPVILLPAFLALPIAVIYLVMVFMGQDVEDLRDNGWMFDKVEHSDFRTQWSIFLAGNKSHNYNGTQTDVHLDLGQVDWGSIALCLPSMFTAVFVVTIDALIKIRSTKKKCHMTMVETSYEMKVAGLHNLLVAFCFGTPGYSQVKFNVLNFHIIHNHVDRKPGIFTGLVCAALFFGSFSDEFINFLPRPVIGMLLVYSGLPFIEDNLIYSYGKLTKQEYVSIWIIIIINAIVGHFTPYGLLIAFTVGLVIATFIFLIQYGQSRTIRRMRTQREYQSVVMRPYIEQKIIENIGIRSELIELEGFLFFGSARVIKCKIKEIIFRNKKRSYAERTRFILMDFHHVLNADSSCVDQFHEFKQIVESNHMRLAFSGLNAQMTHLFRQAKILRRPLVNKNKCFKNLKQDPVSEDKYVRTYPDLDAAAEAMEEKLLTRASSVRQLWLQFDSFRQLRTKALMRASCEIFEPVIDHTTAGGQNIQLWEYAKLRRLEKGEKLLVQQTHDRTLYVVQEGVLTSYSDMPDGTTRRLHKMSRGAFINDECLFAELPVAYNVCADRTSEVWCISQASMRRIQDEQPLLALEIVRRALRHTVTRSAIERLEMIDHIAPTSKVSGPAVAGKRTLMLNATIRMGAAALKRSTISQISEEDAHAFAADRVKSFSGEAGKTPNGEACESDSESPTPSSRGRSPSSRGRYQVAGPKQKRRGGRHSHHHHFMNMPSKRSLFDDGTRARDPMHKETKVHLSKIELELSSAKVHLSKHAEAEARACFLYHAALEADKTASPSNIGVVDGEPKLKVQNIAKAMFPLRLFPTHGELEELVNKLPCAGQQSVSVSDFISLVQHFVMKEISPEDKRQLYQLYKDVCGADAGLSRHALREVLEMLDDDNEDNLEHLWHDWDVEGTGFLTFDAFLSIVSMHLKHEEIEQKFADDFKRLCPSFLRDTNINEATQRISADNVLDFFEELGIPITEDVATEMVFDADLEQNGSVSYDDLLDTITFIPTREMYASLEKEQGLRVTHNSNRHHLYRAMTSDIESNPIHRSLSPAVVLKKTLTEDTTIVEGEKTPLPIITSMSGLPAEDEKTPLITNTSMSGLLPATSTSMISM